MLWLQQKNVFILYILYLNGALIYHILLIESIVFSYLSPVHPGLRILPPETPATPPTQASSQAAAQPASQPARPLKSNSLSLFYKKCKTPSIFHFQSWGGLSSLDWQMKTQLSPMAPLQCTGWPTPGWKCSAPICCPLTPSWSQSYGPCSNTPCSTSTSWWEIATSTR